MLFFTCVKNTTQVFKYNFADLRVFRQKHRKIGNYFDFLINRKNKNRYYSFQICCEGNGLECNLKSRIMRHFRLHKKAENSTETR